MNRQLVFLITLLFLVSVSSLTIRVQRVEASETIYIRANGSVEGTADIWTYDNITYTFTDNINDSIVIERDNIVVDGKGYTVHGTGSGIGIHLSDRNNVTVKNMEIRAFERGIRLEDASNNTISANNVTNTKMGIVLYGSSSQNMLRHNDASDNIYNLGIFTESVFGYIQDIDSSNTVNGKSVYYWINRQDMTVPLDAGYVVLVNCTGITVKNLNLTNNMQGVALSFTTNSIITNNSVTNNFDGVRFDHSSNNNVISGNNITANTNYGIRLFYDPSASGSQPAGPSCNNTIYGNNVTDNDTGIRLDYPSNNTVCANNVANNSDGIGLYGSSSSNTVSENNIINSTYGIWFYSSYDSWIYHNNFIGNIITVYPSFDHNFWDAGYPSGGNYWSSSYHGKDIYSGVYRNETGSDGIGDTPFHLDNYPLMGMFHSFNTSQGYAVDVISNSTINDFEYSESNSTIKVYVSNMTSDQTFGFCRVRIPHTLMNETTVVTVLVNGTEPYYWNYTLYDDGNSRWIYFEYEHSTLEIVIVPELSSLLILPLFMVISIVYVITRKRFDNKP
jgi:parallel beta-helix repeat protein